ncbi:MAG: YbjQ family protein [Bacillota bacterium]
MILVNSNEIAGKEIVETLSLVKGSTIRAKHIGKDIVAGLRHIVGGELKEYTEMIEEARKIATGKMVKEAEDLGADAVISVRFSTTAVMQGAAEIMIYGTAVKLKDKNI